MYYILREVLSAKYQVEYGKFKEHFKPLKWPQPKWILYLYVTANSL